MPKMFDVIQETLRGDAPQPPVAGLIGFALTSARPGEAVVELTATGQHANHMGTLQGGILGAIADAAMGWAYATALEDAETYATLEMKINYLRPVWTGRLLATGRVVKQGRTVGWVECDVTDERQQLVARAMATCITLRGEQARGR